MRILDGQTKTSSLGKPPDFVTIENMRTSSYSRNPRMARALPAFEWVREFNEGTKKIYSGMEKAGLPEPEYALQDGQIVKLTLHNDVERRVPRLMGGKPSFIPSSADGINEETKPGYSENVFVPAGRVYLSANGVERLLRYRLPQAVPAPELCQCLSVGSYE